MKEKEIFDVLKNEAEKTEIPESLRPDNMINKLGEQIDKENEASIDVIEANKELQSIKTTKKPKSKIRKFVTVVGSVAAVAAIAIVGVNVRNMYLDNKGEAGLYKEAKDSVFKTLSSYAELEEYFEAQNSKVDLFESKDDFYNGAIVDEELSEIPEGEMSTSVGDSATSNDSADYSDTNVRTEGVLEADCIKTDGKYIFTLTTEYKDVIDGEVDVYYEGGYDYYYDNYYYSDYKKNVLDIALADGANTEYIVRYDIDAMINEEFDKELGVYDVDMILYDEKLIVIGNYSGDYANYNSETLIAVFDRSDVMDMKLVKCFTVSGAYSQSRMNNGYLYIVSKQKVNGDSIKPYVDGCSMECSDIYISENDDYKLYSIFTSYNMSGEPALVDNKAVIDDGYGELYASTGNFYLLSSSFKDTLFSGSKRTLYIMKLSYVDGIITPVATTEIDGWLEDVFCVDEYNEYLRIVVTSTKNYDEINTLYVFDKFLSETGKIEDIAPGESIYSARFNGDIGYFVTFEQVDPLFTVDLSDPTSPKIIGELKIPGFSEYMHMWNEDRMFGIGEEDGYIKLSMFDISNPYDVKEEDKTVFENMYYSSALYNHKAILVSPDKNIIGFCAEGWVNYGWMEDGVMYDGMMSAGCYYIFAYEDGEFVEKQVVIDEDNFYEDVRGMYIGDYIYVVNVSGKISVISMDDFEIVTSVTK